jgi:hypothetical protein
MLAIHHNLHSRFARPPREGEARQKTTRCIVILMALAPVAGGGIAVLRIARLAPLVPSAEAPRPRSVVAAAADRCRPSARSGNSPVALSRFVPIIVCSGDDFRPCLSRPSGPTDHEASGLVYYDMNTSWAIW